MVALLLMGGVQTTSAQGFLKKIGKAIDSGAKALDKVNKGMGDVMNAFGIATDSTAVNTNGQEKANGQRSTDGNSQQTTKGNTKRGSSILRSNGSTQGTSTNGAAVIATDPKTLGIQFDGVTVETDVTVSLPTTGSKQYACLALMSNYKWAVNTLDDILTLSEQLCYGEQMLTSTKTQQKVTVSILLEQSGFTGSEENVYVQAYLIDVGNRKLLAKGNFVKVDTEKLRNSVENSLPSSEDMGNAVMMGVLGGILENVFSGDFSAFDITDDTGKVTCNYCKGDGVCSVCRGRKVDVMGDECHSCQGYGKCTFCSGTGKVRKPIF